MENSINTQVVTEEEIASVVAAWTGVPVSRLAGRASGLKTWKQDCIACHRSGRGGKGSWEQ